MKTIIMMKNKMINECKYFFKLFANNILLMDMMSENIFSLNKTYNYCRFLFPSCNNDLNGIY